MNDQTDWIKSSYSQRGMDNCVECRTDTGRVLLRDSQHPAHGHLTLSTAEWRAFLHAVRDGEV
ncbi:DUF397 domain-containing protein [Lipingzhangella sp. LS1_29]|uniref:DUF397 domain-containing protein n=1 Tax=Lipingzhangella rawalii TaxID=2055835 RepID=A0ABU2H605_9ACTN|nr:DUF397 domain-containing protein [Lipingzhangella rawalii]MDS1270731.1 DUF397 domain-containing protein [Lipingzhangella rawalii]